MEEERKKLNLNHSNGDKQQLQDSLHLESAVVNGNATEENKNKKKGKKSRKEGVAVKSEKIKKEKGKKKKDQVPGEESLDNTNKIGIGLAVGKNTNQKLNLKNIFSVSNGASHLNALKVDR